MQQDEVDRSKFIQRHGTIVRTAKALHSESLKLVSCGCVLSVAVWRFFGANLSFAEGPFATAKPTCYSPVPLSVSGQLRGM